MMSDQAQTRNQSVGSGPTSHFFTSQRLKLHFVDWGNVKAPPLLLVHGGEDHCRNWDWVAQALRDKWRVIAPDLRGHGDSEHSDAGHYSMDAYIYDLAQLIEQENLAPVTIIGHSLGGNIALRYTGIFPERVRKIVAIEGLGPSPKVLEERYSKSVAERMRFWVDAKRKISGRQPRRYASVDDACKRMQEANKHLTVEQARHLTRYGVNKNEDGTFSWKFDNHARLTPPLDMMIADVQSLWAAIACPTLLAYGENSWASNPLSDGRARYFCNAKVVTFPAAGHWLHHDQLDRFLETIREFL